MAKIHLVKVHKTARQVEPIVVTVVVREFVSDADLKAFARTVANETESSLFGSRVEAYGEGVREIILYRD